MKLTQSEWLSKAEAYLEAAEHLSLVWTDDKEEIKMGKVVESELRKLAGNCYKNASL
jgi:hypothetical protein